LSGSAGNRIAAATRPDLAFRKRPAEERAAIGKWLRRESNPDLAFRKRLFYPLNYGAGGNEELILENEKESVKFVHNDEIYQ
jgi:hypothetical protein